MAYEAIRYELADGVATITLNRPEVHNAMNDRMREELTRCFGDLAQSAEARVVVVTGAGDRAFSAGADIREFVAPQVPVQFRAQRQRVDFRAAMDRCGQPIIAAVRGFALGGGAIGGVAVGGGAAGYFACGGAAAGVHATSPVHRDPAAEAFFADHGLRGLCGDQRRR